MEYIVGANRPLRSSIQRPEVHGNVRAALRDPCRNCGFSGGDLDILREGETANAETNTEKDAGARQSENPIVQRGISCIHRRELCITSQHFANSAFSHATDVTPFATHCAGAACS